MKYVVKEAIAVNTKTPLSEEERGTGSPGQLQDSYNPLLGIRNNLSFT